MFLAKIWFFFVALAGALFLVIALVLPRPAQRQLVADEQQRLAVACGVVDILLTDDARNRLELTGNFARTPEVVAALEAAGGVDKLDEARMKTARDVGETVMKGIQGRQPDFAMLIDKRGRVVARVKLNADEFGDVVAGRPLVDDALAGYLRDDLWAQNNTMYFVSAAPVVRRDAPVGYVGAVVLGHAVTNELASKLVKSLDVGIGFFLDKNDIAGSKSLAFDHDAMLGAYGKLTGDDLSKDCSANQPLQVHAGNDEYTSIVARLPGEAAAKKAYYAVYIKRPQTIGFAGTIKGVRQGDLSWSNFPWILVGGGFLLALGIGIALMFVETDRPLKKLAADSVALAKGERERLAEDAHGGKFGSIARSVNIHIDKLGREAKSARKDMDQLLGPAPEGSLGTIDLLSSALPSALPSTRPGGAAPSVPPAPSDFKFGDGPATPFAPPSAPPVAKPPIPKPAAPPVPKPAAPPIPVAAAPSQPNPAPVLSLDDDILGGMSGSVSTPSFASSPSPASEVDPYFNQVFEQFVAVKKSCGEPTAGLTYAKFSEKLVKNRDDLIAKTGCKEVRFTVYVKDGKAALKATPVKDE